MPKLDAIVIGAGQAGPSLAVRLANAGRRVALIERRALGGTCVNDGCIPTKTLVASARAAWMAREAARFGVRVAGDVSVDMTDGEGAQGCGRAGVAGRARGVDRRDGEPRRW